MKIVKKVTITGATCFFLSALIFSSMASAKADIEDFMGEGISPPSVSKDNRSYRHDSSIPSVEEFMEEGIHFPQAESQREYSYDSSSPSAPEMMSEGLILSDQSNPMVQKQPILNVVVQ